MNRLFTFGCSFTNYNWAMWPEIVRFQHQPKVFKNYGMCGAGNQYIAHQVSLANAEHQFTPDDMVMICWTHVFRKDWFLPTGPIHTMFRGDPESNEWQCEGNVFHPSLLNALMPSELQILSDYLARDLNYIYLTINMLNAMGIPNHQMQIVNVTQRIDDDPLHSFDQDEVNHPQLKPLVEFCEQNITESYDNLINVWPIWFNEFPQDAETKRCDYHPMPMDHIKYLTQTCGMEFSDHTMEVTQRCQDATFEYIRTQRKTRPADFQNFWELFGEHYTGEFKFLDNFL